MRACPSCRAEVNDFDSVCEYCGTELPLNEVFELAIKNAELLNHEAQSMLSESYKLTKSNLNIDRFVAAVKTLNIKYSESELAQKKIVELNKSIRLLEEKIKSFKNRQYKKYRRNAIIFSILGIFAILILISLISTADPNDVEGFVVGIPSLLGLLIGLGLSADSGYAWGGAVVGMMVGGGIGYFIFWLIAIPIGQIIFLFGGTVGIIIGLILGLKKAKKKWQ